MALSRPGSPSLSCRPQEDPFLLLESTFHAVQAILRRRQGLPLQRTWIDVPYGEEEITLLEEEVLPALKLCLARLNELDGRLLAQQEILQRCLMEADRAALAGLDWAIG